MAWRDNDYGNPEWYVDDEEIAQQQEYANWLAAQAAAKDSAVSNIKSQILNQWKQIGATNIGGGLSIDDRAQGLAERLYANQITDLAKLGLGSGTVSSPYQAYLGEGGEGPTYETRYEDTPTSYLTYDGRQIGFLGDIGTAENWAPTGYLQPGNLASWGAQGKGAVSYTVQKAPNGQVYFIPSWGSTSDLGSIAPLISLASIIPSPIQPIAAAANAAIALDQGNVLGGLASLAGIPGVSEAAGAAGLGSAVSGIQTANQANNLVNAVQSGNLAGALASGAGLTGTSGATIGDTGITLGQAAKGLGALQAAQSGNYSPLLNTIAGYATSDKPSASDFAVGSMDTPGGTVDAGISGLLGTGAEITAQQQAAQQAAQQQQQQQQQQQAAQAAETTVTAPEQAAQQAQGVQDLLGSYQPAPAVSGLGTLGLDNTPQQTDNTAATTASGAQNMDDYDQFLSDIGIAPSTTDAWSNASSPSNNDILWNTGYFDDVLSGGGEQSAAETARLAQQEATATGTPVDTSVSGADLATKLKKLLTQPQVGNVTGLGLLAGLGGIAGIKSLLAADNARYGVPGRQDWTGPVSQYKFNPAVFQPTVADPAMFRPTGVQTAKQGYAAGGQTKPAYTAKSKLAAMSPWERSAAELNNAAYLARMPAGVQMPQAGISQLGQFAAGGGISDLGSYSDGGRLLRGPGDGVSDSIPATIGEDRPARLADGEFVIPARIVSELGNGSTDAGARQLYAMMDRIQKQRARTTGKNQVAKDTKAAKQLPA
jgi:hypothetical protein